MWQHPTVPTPEKTNTRRENVPNGCHERESIWLVLGLLRELVRECTQSPFLHRWGDAGALPPFSFLVVKFNTQYVGLFGESWRLEVGVPPV